MSATTTSRSLQPAAGPASKVGRWHRQHPNLGTGPLPADVYTSQEQFQLEREHIFKKVWLNVGRVEQIAKAERFLHGLGMTQVRVRHHGDIARIEVDAESMPLLIERGSQIASHLRELGFAYVAADLEGYRTGSMNETLAQQDDE